MQVLESLEALGTHEAWVAKGLLARTGFTYWAPKWSHGHEIHLRSVPRVFAQGGHVLAIPGTRFEDRAKENLDAASAVVSEHVILKAASILSPESIIGDRWSETILREVDSEQFRFA